MANGEMLLDGKLVTGPTGALGSATQTLRDSVGPKEPIKGGGGMSLNSNMYGGGLILNTGGTNSFIPPNVSNPVSTGTISNGNSLNLPPSSSPANPGAFVNSIAPTPMPSVAPTSQTPNLQMATASPTASTSSIPFKPGLSDTQKAGITSLSQKPSDQWSPTDIANWNYATNGAPRPGGSAPAGSTGQNIPFKPGLTEQQKQGIQSLANKPVAQWSPTDKNNWNFATNGASLPGTPPTNSTTSAPSGESTMGQTGDYTQDPGYQAAQQGLNTAQTNYSNALNATPSLADSTKAAYETGGVNADMKKVQDLNTQLAQLQAAFNNASAATETKGITSGTPAVFYQGEQAAMARQQAVQVGSKAIELQAAQGNYTMAKELADQTVQMAFQDAQNKINNTLAFVNLNQQNLSSAEKVAVSKMQAQAQQAQAALDAQKSALSLQLSYPQAGITSKDTLVQATQKASAWLAKNPHAGQSPIVTGTYTDADGNTRNILSFTNPDGSISDSYNPISGSQGNTNLGISTGNMFGVPLYNTQDNNPGLDRATRNNNSGNIKATANSVKLPGVVGVDMTPSSDGGNFLIFDTPAHSVDAIKGMITNPSSTNYGGNVTAAQAMSKYKNMNASAGAAMAAKLGLDPNANFQKQLKDPAALDAFIQKLVPSEGGGSSSDSSKAGTLSALYSDFLQGRTQEAQNAFNSLNETQKSNVEQIISGKALLSDLISSKGVQASKDKQKLLLDAKKVDPTFSENTNKLRYEFLKKWTSPDSAVGKNNIAINTALGHLADVKEMTNGLTPSDQQWINKTKNWWDVQSGSPTITNLQFGLNQLATEIAAVWKGGNAAPTEQEIAAQKAVLGTQLSKSQFQGLLDKQAQFLSSKITASRYSYKSTMGQEFPQSIIDPDKRQALINAGIDPNVIVKENIGSQDTQATNQLTDDDIQAIQSASQYPGAFVQLNDKSHILILPNNQYIPGLTLDEVNRTKALPVGSVITYSDGTKIKKTGNNQYQPV